MKYNIIYLSGGRQKSYLAAARRVIWRPLEEINYVAAARRVKYRPVTEGIKLRAIVLSYIYSKHCWFSHFSLIPSANQNILSRLNDILGSR